MGWHGCPLMSYTHPAARGLSSLQAKSELKCQIQWLHLGLDSGVQMNSRHM